MTVEFMDSGYKTISTDNIDIVVPSDSEQWETPRSTVKFDGSEDIVFKFKNGTNFFEIGDVSGIYIFYSKPIGIDMYEGYTLDAAAGEVRIDKNTFINALKSYDYDEPCRHCICYCIEKKRMIELLSYKEKYLQNMSDDCIWQKF